MNSMHALYEGDDAVVPRKHAMESRTEDGPPAGLIDAQTAVFSPAYVWNLRL